MRFLPGDVIVGLLANLFKRRITNLSVDPIDIHPLVYKWRADRHYANLFKDFTFDTREYYPYSRTIDDVMDSLVLAGYLVRADSRASGLRIRKGIANLYESEVKGTFNRAETKALVRLSENLANQLSHKIPNKKAVVLE